MTPASFKSAQLTLGLNNAQMAAWLGVSLRTVEQWRATGPSKLGARAVGLALKMNRFVCDFEPCPGDDPCFANVALDWRG